MLICFLALCLQMQSNAQDIWKGDTNDLNRESLLKTIPSFDVRDKQGNVHKLNEYISTNKLHNDKPFLIVIWGTDGSKGLGINELNELDSAKIADQFNIVALCLSHEKDKDKQAVYMQDLMTEYKIKNKWGKFITAVTDWEGLANFYIKYFPRLIYADKKMNIVSTGFLTKNGFEKEILNDIQKNLVKPGETWYNKEGDLVVTSNPNAHYYRKYTINANQINFKYGTKTNLLLNVNYIKKGDEYLIEGVYESNYETGKAESNGVFKEGAHSATYKAWYEDGTINKIIPINGTLKFFDKAGKVIYEGPMKNGLGDGLFTKYVEEKKVKEISYSTGIVLGLQRIFNDDGSLYSERYASPNYEDVLKRSLSEGLQGVIINGKWGFVDRNGNVKINPIYEYAGEFINGSVHVTLGGQDFYINKKGERTSEKWIGY